MSPAYIAGIQDASSLLAKVPQNAELLTKDRGAAANPVVSVVMPVYNAQAYVQAALDSLKSQTFTNFEVVVVDDGSTDQSAKLVAAAAKQDRRIYLNRLGRHLGVTAALNSGLGLARGRYIARLDADDLALPQRLARQLDRLQGESALVAIGCAVTWMDVDGLTIGDHPYPPDHAAVMERLLAGRSGLPHTGVMMRTQAARQVGGYRLEFPVAQDFDLWLRLSQVGQLANLPEPLVLQRKHRASVTGRRRREQLALRDRALEEHRARTGQSVAPAAGRPKKRSEAQCRYARARLAWSEGHRRAARKHATYVLCRRPWRWRMWPIVLARD